MFGPKWILASEPDKCRPVGGDDWPKAASSSAEALSPRSSRFMSQATGACAFWPPPWCVSCGCCCTLGCGLAKLVHACGHLPSHVLKGMFQQQLADLRVNPSSSRTMLYAYHTRSHAFFGDLHATGSPRQPAGRTSKIRACDPLSLTHATRHGERGGRFQCCKVWATHTRHSRDSIAQHLT
jgi:hypothetical protein